LNTSRGRAISWRWLGWTVALDGGGAQNSTLPLQRRPEVVFSLFSPWVEDRE